MEISKTMRTALRSHMSSRPAGKDQRARGKRISRRKEHNHKTPKIRIMPRPSKPEQASPIWTAKREVPTSKFARLATTLEKNADRRMRTKSKVAVVRA